MLARVLLFVCVLAVEGCTELVPVEDPATTVEKGPIFVLAGDGSLLRIDTHRFSSDTLFGTGVRLNAAGGEGERYQGAVPLHGIRFIGAECVTLRNNVRAFFSLALFTLFVIYMARKENHHARWQVRL
jgi:hypothetical protein